MRFRISGELVGLERVGTLGLTSRVVDGAGDDLVNRHDGWLFQMLVSFDGLRCTPSMRISDKEERSGYRAWAETNSGEDHDSVVGRTGQKLTL